MRLVMPPSVSVPLGDHLRRRLLPGPRQPRLSTASAAGFLGGDPFYDMTHYYVHHRRPKTALGKRLRELHMRHHFQDPDTSFRDQCPVLGQGIFGSRSVRASVRGPQHLDPGADTQ